MRWSIISNYTKSDGDDDVDGDGYCDGDDADDDNDDDAGNWLLSSADWAGVLRSFEHFGLHW